MYSHALKLWFSKKACREVSINSKIEYVLSILSTLVISVTFRFLLGGDDEDRKAEGRSEENIDRSPISFDKSSSRDFQLIGKSTTAMTDKIFPSFFR